MHLLPSPVLFQPVRRFEGALLRPGNVHSADGWKELLEPIVTCYEKKTVRKYFRGDAAFAKPEIL